MKLVFEIVLIGLTHDKKSQLTYFATKKKTTNSDFLKQVCKMYLYKQVQLILKGLRVNFVILLISPAVALNIYKYLQLKDMLCSADLNVSSSVNCS